MQSIESPLHCRIVEWQVRVGDLVHEGDLLVVLEAMKMEHELRAPMAARVVELLFEPGELVEQGQVLMRLAPMPESAREQEPSAVPGPVVAAGASAAVHAAPPHAVATSTPGVESPVGPDLLRADLRTVIERHARTLDASRPQAMARRHALGLRSARENIADLCDAGSFNEYGALAVAAQRARRSEDDLQRNTPADGIVCGIGSVNGATFGAGRARTVVLAYGMFIAAAHLRVPFVSVVLRKGYGLGAMAMAGGSLHAPLATAAWPSAEFGAMGLEGAVRLGYRKELEALPEGPQRDALFQRLLDAQIAQGGAIPMAQTLEIDAVIDPAHTRDWIVRTLQSGAVKAPGGLAIDSW